MQKWDLNNQVLEFNEETHQYYLGGEEIQSVTSFLKKVFPTKYEGIDPEILQRAAQRGTNIHEEIQMYEIFGFEGNTKEFENFKILKKYYEFRTLEAEIPVIIKLDGLTLAGRLDGLFESYKAKRFGIYDIKTTSVLDKEYLTWQLNLYRIGYHQTYNDFEITELAGLHLRKDIRRYVFIPIKEEWIKEEIKKYIGEKTNE